MPAPLKGTASVSPLPARLPPATAEWTVDTEKKVSTAPMFGGLATVFRKPNGALAGEFILKRDPNPEVEGDEGVDIKLKLGLRTSESVFEAQRRAEAVIRTSLSKTHPELLGEIEAAEAEERVSQAGEDPF